MSAIFKNRKTNEALTLIRGYHFAKTLNLSKTTINHIYRQVESLFEETVTLQNDRLEPTLDASISNSPTHTQHPDVHPLISIQNRIRILIASDARWDTLVPLIKSWLELEEFKPEVCSKAIELAFLNTDSATAYSFYREIRGHQGNFYFLIHNDVRNVLVLKKLGEKSTNDIFHLIYKKFGSSELLDTEIYLIFRNLLQLEQKREALEFYKKNEETIWKVSKKYVKSLDLSSAKLAIKIAVDLAAETDHHTVLKILKKIQFNAPEYTQAKKLIKDLQNKQSLTPYAFEDIQELLKVSSYTEKLSLISGQFNEFYDKQIPVPRNHPAQNYLIEFEKWLPKDFKNYRQLAEVVLNHIHCIDELYSVENVLIKMATNFKSTDLDIAFWSGLNSETIDPYWRGVALAHLYTASSTENNIQRLWTSRSLLLETHRHKSLAYPSWKSIHKLVLENTRISKKIDSSFKSERIKQILVSAHEEHLQISDINDFIHSANYIPANIAEDIAKISEKRSLKDLHLKLLRKQVVEYSLTNSNLNNLWLKCENKDRDLAWRIATVLNGRQAAKKSAQYAWLVSGENRTTYNFSRVGLPTLEKLLEGLEKDERNFIKAMIVIGPHLPLVFSLIHKSSKTKYTNSEVGLDLTINANFTQQIWYETPKYVYSSPALGFDFLSHRYPAFYKIPSSNIWAKTLTYVLDYIGGYSWKWNIDDLQHHLNLAMPLSESNKTNIKLANWYRSLRSEQKKSWEFLNAKSARFETNEMVHKLFLFACKLTSCLYPSHVGAIATLQRSRVPFLSLREYECWLISDNYTQIRQQMKIDNKMMLPQNLVGKSILSHG